MALLEALREAPRFLGEQPILIVPMAILAIHRTLQLLSVKLDSSISIAGIDEPSFRSNSPMIEHGSDTLDSPHPSA